MVIKIHIQTKVDENKDVKIAEDFEIEENTQNREIIVFIQELKHFITFLENELYNDWINKSKK